MSLSELLQTTSKRSALLRPCFKRRLLILALLKLQQSPGDFVLKHQLPRPSKLYLEYLEPFLVFWVLSQVKNDVQARNLVYDSIHIFFVEDLKLFHGSQITILIATKWPFNILSGSTPPAIPKMAAESLLCTSTRLLSQSSRRLYTQ